MQLTMSINTADMPDVLKDSLLEAMTAPLTTFYADPENQQKYEAWLAKRRAAGKE